MVIVFFLLEGSTKNVVKAIKEIKTCDQIVHQKDFVIGSCEMCGCSPLKKACCSKD